MQGVWEPKVHKSCTQGRGIPNCWAQLQKGMWFN